MSNQRQSFVNGATAVLGLAVLATCCLPIYAQAVTNDESAEAKNSIGIQFGIQGGELPFVKPLITRLFTDVDVVCGADGCQVATGADPSCCEKSLGDVVAHFCRQDAECAGCSEASCSQCDVVSNSEEPTEFDALMEALTANAALEAELGMREQFDQERQQLRDELLAREIENVELKAELKLAEQRHELQRQLMETIAENMRLQTQIELAQQKQQFVERYAEGIVQNEKLKLQISAFEHSTKTGKQAQVSQAKTKSPRAKRKQKTAATKRRSGVRTAKKATNAAGSVAK